MENLNAEQIKKALECCTVGIGTECEKCPYMRTAYCNDVLKKEVLALITSQEQRIGAQDMTISELRQRAEKAEHDADRYAQKIKELTKDKERLQKANDVLLLMTSVKEIRADTVRKMQERLKAEMRNTAKYSFGGREYSVIGEGFIDQIAKEMLEGKDDNT